MRTENRKRLREMTLSDICKNNDLGNTVMTNIVDEEITKKKIRATLQIIAKTLCRTLGPDGATTILQDVERQHLVSKDGLDVITRINFQDEVARTILEMVKSISLNQVLSVGDGSTSSIVVANALYQELTAAENKEIFKYVPPKVIVDILNFICEYIESELKSHATPLSEDYREIANIASIAMNNDEVVGKLVQEIYAKIGKFGFISTDTGENYEEDVVDYKKGISWKRGYISPIYGEKYESRTVIHEKPYVFITNSPITADDMDAIYRPLIGAICAGEKRELIIVGNYISDEAKNFFNNVRELYKLNPSKQELIFTVVDMEQVTETGINRLRDLALLCGCEIFNKAVHTAADVSLRVQKEYTKDDKYKFIGKALRGTITKQKTEIICDDELISAEALKLKNETIAKITSDLEILNSKSVKTGEDVANMFALKERKSNLENLTAIIHIGGRSYQERRTRERLFEDAIFASKSAIDYGYIVGGNIMIPKILTEKKDELAKQIQQKFDYLEQSVAFFDNFIDILIDSFLESYRSVLDNSQTLTDEKIDEILSTVIKEDSFYNLKKHKYEKFSETTVINSVNTDIQILKSCISLIGLLATSNQIITLNCSVRDQI